MYKAENTGPEQADLRIFCNSSNNGRFFSCDGSLLMCASGECREQPT